MVFSIDAEKSTQKPKRAKTQCNKEKTKTDEKPKKTAGDVFFCCCPRGVVAFSFPLFRRLCFSDGTLTTLDARRPPAEKASPPERALGVAVGNRVAGSWKKEDVGVSAGNQSQRWACVPVVNAGILERLTSRDGLTA